jgi:cohesin complex subunit SA-1/2
VILSSSTFRPVRHTSTLVGLNILSSLAGIASEIQDELNITSRQLATNQKDKSAQTKIRQLEKKLKEGKEREADVLKWINEIFDR